MTQLILVDVRITANMYISFVQLSDKMGASLQKQAQRSGPVCLIFSSLTISTQRVYDVKTTSYKRRCIDIDTTSYWHHMPIFRKGNFRLITEYMRYLYMQTAKTVTNLTNLHIFTCFLRISTVQSARTLIRLRGYAI